MASDSRGGGKAALLMVLVLGLAAAGGYNYWRNLQAEEAELGARPLAGYDDAGLAALAEAYRVEIEDLELARTRARQRHDGPGMSEMIGDNVREFERVQASSRKLRDLGGDIAAREARLAEAEQELAYRERLANGGFALHLQRLTAI